MKYFYLFIIFCHVSLFGIELNSGESNKRFYLDNNLLNYQSMYIGVSQILIKPDNYIDILKPGILAGLGMSRTYGNFLLAGSLNLKLLQLNKENFYSGNLELNLGYHIYVTNAYLIAGYQVSKFKEYDYKGFGYGVGVETRIFKDTAIVTEFTKYKMIGIFDYEERTTSFKVKYIF